MVSSPNILITQDWGVEPMQVMYPRKQTAFVHYSYEKSSKQLMLLDIQGCEYTLFDPEIASATLQVDKEYLFGVGNLTSHAIETFVENQVLHLGWVEAFPRSLPKEDERLIFTNLNILQCRE